MRAIGRERDRGDSADLGDAVGGEDRFGRAGGCFREREYRGDHKGGQATDGGNEQVHHVGGGGRLARATPGFQADLPGVRGPFPTAAAPGKPLLGGPRLRPAPIAG